MRITRKNLIIAQFIPVILAISYYLFQYHFIYFTHTILGKLVLIAIVMFYSVAIDKLLGAALALLFIFYYQTDRVEGFYSLHMIGADGSGAGADDPTEGFQDGTATAALMGDYKNKIDELMNRKIDVEDEILMPKQSNNIHVDLVGGGDTIAMGTPGVISEEFTTYK